jgi:hypothetical protein
MREILASFTTPYGLGQTEVQHLDPALRCPLDVGGFQIAVDDSFFVRGFQGLGHLMCRFESGGHGQWAVQRFAFH